ncbi:ComF family protein [Candidatus Kaiserbacteria bacterium]|nr:ComF family protein [Candidatus Kaiserbacteria bacterium]
MLRFFQTLLDTILPRKERVVRIDSYSMVDLAVSPSQHDAYGVEITTLMSYRTKAADDLIRALKYDRATHAAQILADVLAEYLQEEIASIRMFSAKQVILVPVPLHASRVAERGFNQIEVVLQQLPEEFRDGTVSRIAADLLSRTRATPQQTRLSRSERLKNVAGAFAARGTMHDYHAMIIDDVTTTGATLAEAAMALEKEGATVTAIALARA